MKRSLQLINKHLTQTQIEEIEHYTYLDKNGTNICNDNRLEGIYKLFEIKYVIHSIESSEVTMVTL